MSSDPIVGITFRPIKGNVMLESNNFRKDAKLPKSDRADLEELQEGIFRISTYDPQRGITFNQFVIKDSKSALIHTGPAGIFGGVDRRIREIMDPSKLRYVVFLHFESDEWGGMPFLESPAAQLVCSRLSSRLNLQGWDSVPLDHVAVWEGDRLSLGGKCLRFLMTPHVHHWDSMMVFEEATKALFPADLFIQSGQGKPVTTDRELGMSMIKRYRDTGIFAHERPVRAVLPKLERLNSAMIHPMHGSSLESSVHGEFFRVLRTEDFAYRGKLYGDAVSEY